MNKQIKNIVKYSLYPLYRIYRYALDEYMKTHPKWVAEKVYKKEFGRPINWEHPTEMNEKIRWMQFNSDTSKWTELADKYKMREYVKKKGYGDILVPLLGVWKDARDIDFTKLPESFVIKTNHANGDSIIVHHKSQTDLEKVRNKMKRSLKQHFGDLTAEPHYLSIPPCIIAEKKLQADANISSSIIDYKFFCTKGKPHCCYVGYDRNPITHEANWTVYDMQWLRHDEWKSPHLATPSKDIPRPITLKRMIQVCHDLGSEFPFVRLDFYESEGKLYFGEFTFTPAALAGGFLSCDLSHAIGREIELPQKV